MQKSSDYLFQRIMSNFSPAEQAAYAGRIIRDLNRLQRDPKLTKIVLLDDWSISGTQLANGMGEVVVHPRVSPAHQQNVEVHLVAASAQQLDSLRPQGRPVRTYAYFRTDQSNTGEPFVTGTHSSVDFQFEQPIQEAVARRNQLHSERQVSMPPLTNIRRNYDAYREACQAPNTQRGRFFQRVYRKVFHS